MQPINLPCKFASPPRPNLFASENKIHTPIQSVCHSATSELVSSFQPKLTKGYEVKFCGNYWLASNIQIVLSLEIQVEKRLAWVLSGFKYLLILAVLCPTLSTKTMW